MEPAAAADGPEESVSGEGPSPPAPKPRGPKRGAAAAPKTVTTRAAARTRAKAPPASRRAPKAKEGEEPKAVGGEEEAAKAESGEGERGGQESPLVDEAKNAQASQPQPLPPLTKEAGQTASPKQSPDGAREQNSHPQLPMIEQDELLSLPPETPSEEPAAKRAKTTPEATFTPPVAGLRPKETQEPQKSPPKEAQKPQITPRIRLMISEAIAQGIAAGIQKNQPAPDHAPPEGQPPAPDNPRDLAALPRPHSPALSMHSQESLSDDEEHQGLLLSGDKGGTLDLLDFKGLFRPALFKTLLHRAKATAQIGVDPATSDPALGLSDPNSLVFSEPTTDKEEIPAPKLFLDAVQRQWAQPGGYPGPNLTDRRFYNVAPNLTAALEMPTIDEPVAALACVNMITNNLDEALTPEDRKAEVTLRKAYNASAWAIKSATAASFFNRTSVLWLKEIQARIPATDLQAHQILNNLVMAAEYCADATLNSAKFASRSIGSSVTARRLLWLRHWHANMRFKWKLASAPFKGENLFGEALEPMLIETKDKKKVLRSIPRRPNQQSQNPSFRAADTENDFSQPQAAYVQPQDRQSNRWSQNPSFRAADTGNDFSQQQGAYVRPQDRQSNRRSEKPSFTAADTGNDFSQPQGAYVRPQDRQSNRRTEKSSFRAADTKHNFSKQQGAYSQHQDRQSDRPGNRDKNRQQLQSKQPSQDKGSRTSRSVRSSMGGNERRRDVEDTKGSEHHPTRRRSRYSLETPKRSRDSLSRDKKSSHRSSSATPVRHSSHHSSDSRPKKTQQPSDTQERQTAAPPVYSGEHPGGRHPDINRSGMQERQTAAPPVYPEEYPGGRHPDMNRSGMQEHQTAVPPVYPGEHPGGRHPDINRSDRSIGTSPYIADSPAIPMVLVHEPALPVQSPPVRPVFSTQNIHADPSNALGSPQDYPYSRQTLPERHVDPNFPPPANRRSPLQVTDPSIARILSQLQRDLVLAYRQTTSPRSTYRQDNMHSLPVPGPPGQHQSSGEPDPRRPPLTAVRQGGVIYRHPSLDTSAYQGRAVAPPALPEMWPEQYNYRSPDPIRNPPMVDVSGHNQGMYIQGTEPSRHSYGRQFVQPRTPHGDPDGTRLVVTGGRTIQVQPTRAHTSPPSPPDHHLQARRASPERRRSHQDSYQRPREQPSQVPQERRQSQGRTASSNPARRR